MGPPTLPAGMTSDPDNVGAPYESLQPSVGQLHSAKRWNTLSGSKRVQYGTRKPTMEEQVESFCHPDQSDHQFRGFERLMETYHHFLINRLRKRFFSSNFDQDRLEEFAQRTWIKVWEHRTSFCAKNPRNFRSWLFTIGINEVLQDFRKKRPGTIPEDFDQQDADSMAPDQSAMEQEQRLTLHDSLELSVGDEDLRKCLERLKNESPKSFDALVSKILDDSSQSQILMKYNIDRPTLSRLRWKAAQIVRDCIVGSAS
ncbi:MAG: RNA polymerase sigma factor [Planctomycetota bacterium]|jgi:RNA polymerase sigma factor (sigma-70 family)